jgi:uncharacterized BrkB/YihY/UPF0761 family membrane protein
LVPKRSLATLVIVLVWVYYSAQILLFGVGKNSVDRRS